MKRKNPLIAGTLILTLTGLISRVIGFFYRVFLSQMFGEEGMGIYQLISPVMALSYSLTVSGVQTAISKFVASETTDHNYKASLRTLLAGLSISVPLSVICSIYIYTCSDSIAVKMLLEPRTAPLLRILALSIPFGIVHSCINGYFYGVKKASLPAATQMVEQLTRVLSVYCIFSYFTSHNMTPTISLALVGLLLGECSSMLVSLTAVFLRFASKYCRDSLTTGFAAQKLQIYKNILKLAIPLSANRIVINMLQSLEAVYIPSRLQAFGLNNSEAMSVYGVLSGMALPVILFPSALTNSAAVLLLPIVSEADSNKNRRAITKAVRRSIQCCLVMGGFCTAVFLLFGRAAGMLLFHSELAGSFIITLSFICPFLYLTTMLNSILHGLGKAMQTFIFSVCGLLIRLAFVFAAVPYVGIKGYLWGLLASELFITVCTLYALRDYIKKE